MRVEKPHSLKLVFPGEGAAEITGTREAISCYLTLIDLPYVVHLKNEAGRITCSLEILKTDTPAETDLPSGEPQQ
jgi:hypothetical protein